MIQFGTGGWRAVIGDEFTKANVQKLAYALSLKMQNENVADQGIVIGYDKRFLSKEAMQWAGTVFAANGMKAFLINQSMPTPTVMFYVKQYNMPYGMMVTASHNPAIYNGIKVFTSGGRDADEKQTEEIEKYIDEIENQPVPELDYGKAKEKGLIEEIYPLNEYIDSIMAQIDIIAIRNAGLRISLDPMYGVSEKALKTILYAARCDINVIHDNHDTLFGGKLPAPNANTLRALQNLTTDWNCDLGIATDGDADRLGVIDDTGRFLHPNEILVLLYYYLLKYKNMRGPVVRNICTTHILDKLAKKYGQKCYEVPVGFKYISDKMNQTDAIIGGESSGGLTVKGHIQGKDSVYAAALLIEMVALTGKKLSVLYKEIEAEYGKIHLEERDYRFTKEKVPSIQKKLLQDKQLPEFPYEIDHISYMDGCKIYFKNGGWFAGRFSGTEPLFRIFTEMPEQQQAKEVCEEFETYLKLTDNS